MDARLDFFKANPDLIKAQMGVEKALLASGLPTKLVHLIRLRASQINGCAYCIAMHTKEARRDGEDQRRLDLLQAYDETEIFTEAEKAALAWTEALTEVSRTHASDAVYARLAASYDDAAQVAVTMAIASINAWNRFAIGFRKPPEV